MNRIGSVGSTTPFDNAAQLNAAADSVQSKRVAFAPFLMLGAQKRLAMFSVFAHGTGTFLHNDFFLHNPRPKLGSSTRSRRGCGTTSGSRSTERSSVSVSRQLVDVQGNREGLRSALPIGPFVTGPCLACGPTSPSTCFA